MVAESRLSELQLLGLDLLGALLVRTQISIKEVISDMGQLKKGKLEWEEFCESESVGMLADQAEDIMTSLANITSIDEDGESLMELEM